MIILVIIGAILTYYYGQNNKHPSFASYNKNNSVQIPDEFGLHGQGFDESFKKSEQARLPNTIRFAHQDNEYIKDINDKELLLRDEKYKTSYRNLNKQGSLMTNPDWLMDPLYHNREVNFGPPLQLNRDELRNLNYWSQG